MCVPPVDDLGLLNHLLQQGTVEGGEVSQFLGSGTGTAISTCAVDCLHFLLLKEEQETLTSVFFIPQELMEGLGEPDNGKTVETQPLGSRPLPF